MEPQTAPDILALETLARQAEPNATLVTVRVWSVQWLGKTLWRAEYLAHKPHGTAVLTVQDDTEEGAKDVLRRAIRRAIARRSDHG